MAGSRRAAAHADRAASRDLGPPRGSTSTNIVTTAAAAAACCHRRRLRTTCRCRAAIRAAVLHLDIVCSRFIGGVVGVVVFLLVESASGGPEHVVNGNNAENSRPVSQIICGNTVQLSFTVPSTVSGSEP